MSDTPTPEAGTLEGHIKDFVEMDLQIAALRATLAAKDRLLERAVNALSDLKLAWRRYDYERSSHGTRAGCVMAEDDLNRMNTLADEIIASHRETTPNPA